MTIHYVWFGIALFVVAFVMCWLVYPLVLRFARIWGFYDNPDARKLQRVPVPVLGGPAVFFGILTGILILITVMFDWKLVWMFGAMASLLVLGMIDDRVGLKPGFRLIMEVIVISALILLNGSMIDNLHGLWGIRELPLWLSFVLSVITGVGIINAINMIDGVDGYSSGFITICCSVFALIFFAARIRGLAILCMIAAGSLIPFFIHNVFGVRSKMFIGDSGTLMLGTLLTIMIFSLLKSNSAAIVLENQTGLNLIAVALASLSIPVADTLRVMTGRIFKGSSPFNADKTHLHHLFIDFGFTHISTTFTILCLYLTILASLVVAWLCGASGEVQLYVVVGISLLLDNAVYAVARFSQKRGGPVARILTRIGKSTDPKQTRAWELMKKLADDELLEDGRL